MTLWEHTPGNHICSEIYQDASIKLTHMFFLFTSAGHAAETFAQLGCRDSPAGLLFFSTAKRRRSHVSMTYPFFLGSNLAAGGCVSCRLTGHLRFWIWNLSPTSGVAVEARSGCSAEGNSKDRGFQRGRFVWVEPCGDRMSGV